MDYKKFFDSLRADGIGLTEANVAGFERIVNYCEAYGCNLQVAAYDTATAYHESGHTCQPVEECFYLGSPAKVKAAQQKLKYYPFFGRGLVQTTHRENYEKAAALLGLPKDTFVKNPGLLLEWDYALPLLVKAMDVGLYTGKSVGDYIDAIDEDWTEDLREFTNARRVVNGTDRAADIGKIALKLEAALKAGGYGIRVPEVEPVQPELPLQPVPPAATEAPTIPAMPPAPAGFWLRLWVALKAAMWGD